MYIIGAFLLLRGRSALRLVLLEREPYVPGGQQVSVPPSTSRVLFWRQTVALVEFLSFRGFAGRRAGRWTDFCHRAERSPSGTPGKMHFRNEDSIFAATMHFRCETYQTYPNFTFCQMLTHLQTFATLWRACSRLYRSRFCD